MLRLLLLAILIFLLVRFVVKLGRLAAAALREGSSPAAPPRAVPLVACRRCGVFVPRAAAAGAPADGFLCRACAGAGG